MATKPRREACLLSEQASRLLGIPGWRAYLFECVEPKAILLKGLVPDVFYKRGKSAGRPNWSKCSKATLRTCVLSRDQIAAFEIEWERETGHCAGCFGNGTVVDSVSIEGSTYRHCAKCKVTGKAGLR